jgi:hypothetical protein
VPESCIHLQNFDFPPPTLYYPTITLPTTMSTDTEVKLLTLLNVAAIKKPRDLDIPGGQRGSPALNSRTASPVPAPALKSKGAKANGKE